MTTPSNEGVPTSATLNVPGTSRRGVIALAVGGVIAGTAGALLARPDPAAAVSNGKKKPVVPSDLSMTYDEIRLTSAWPEGVPAFVCSSGHEGTFLVDPSDTSSPDNGGTVLVNATGQRFLRQHERGTVQAAWFAAAGGPLTAAAVNAAIAATRLAAADRAVVRLPVGTHEMGETIVIPSHTALIGEGRGITILRLAAGANCDVIRSDGFDEFVGQAAISSAPRYIAVRDLTIDGNYLANAWNSATNTINNTTGSGIRFYARLFEIDVEVNNVAEHALYLEGAGSRGSDDVRSLVRLNGRVSGKEGVVFRGIGDIVLEEILFGLAGILPRPIADTVLPITSIFSGASYGGYTGVDGLVIDKTQSYYEGNVELGFVHVYACYNGVGIRSWGGGCRIEGSHIVSESNLGGVDLSSTTYGYFSTLSVRNNGRHHPNLSIAKPAPRPGLSLAGTIGFLVSAYHCFRSVATASSEGWTGLVITGTFNKVGIVHANSTNPTTGNRYVGDAVHVSGSSNEVTGVLRTVNGDGVVMSGANNRVDVVIQEVINGTAIVRSAGTGGANRGNRISANITNSPVALRSEGYVSAESIDITVALASGQVVFEGDEPQSDGQRWAINGAVGGIPVTTAPRVSAAVDATSTAEQEIVIPHGAVLAPVAHDVVCSLVDRSSTPSNARLDYLQVRSVDASSVTIIVKLRTAGTTADDLNVVAHVR